MPSDDPSEWQADLRASLSLLAKRQCLIASVVGTGTDRHALVGDFVRCAELASEVGPHAIELNLSCPNVYGPEGAIFQDAELAQEICKRVRKAVKDIPVIAKLGYLTRAPLTKVYQAISRHIDGITAINTLPVKVLLTGQREEPAFAGPRRIKAGISGLAIRDLALESVKVLRELADAERREFVIIGVGGVSSSADAKGLLDSGATCIQMCTGVLLNPLLAIQIRNEVLHPSAASARSRVLSEKAPFYDKNTAEAFDNVIAACAKLRIPFEDGYAVLNRRWLSGYVSDLRQIHDRGAPGVRTRRSLPPSESEIVKWIREEIE